RTGYLIGKSEIVCYGFDDSERIKSSEYDLAYCNEATELTIDDWEILLSRLRHGKLGWHQAIADCNPGAPSHWLNKRAEAGRMRRFTTTQIDNPAYYDLDTQRWTEVGRPYLERLDRLTGVRHKRLRLGIWCAAEGIVYADFDPAIHVIDKPIEPIERCVVGVDWGFRDPGVFQVWGTDSAGRMYRIHEVYRTGQTIDWWIEHARRIQTDYKPRAWLPDPSEPGYIEQLRRAVEPLGGNVETWAVKRETPMEQTTQAHHPKDIRYGIDIVAARLRARPDGTRGIYWIRGAVA